MTQDKIIRDYEKLLDGGAEDPMYQMMLVMMNFIMQMDAERKTGVAKGEYSEDHLTGVSYINADPLRKQKIEWEKEQKVA